MKDSSDGLIVGLKFVDATVIHTRPIRLGGVNTPTYLYMDARNTHERKLSLLTLVTSHNSQPQMMMMMMLVTSVGLDIVIGVADAIFLCSLIMPRI